MEAQEANGATVQANGEESTRDETVKYETYQKAMSTIGKRNDKISNLESELEQLRKEKSDAEQARMVEDGKWKDLAEKYQNDLKAVSEERDQVFNSLRESVKRSAFDAETGGLKSDDYYNLVPWDKIGIGEDFSVDTDSLKSAINDFSEKHQLLIRDKAAKALPSKAPQAEQKTVMNTTNQEGIANALKAEIAKALG